MKSVLFLFFISLFISIGAAASSIEISTTSVPNGTVETAYSAVIKASGGCTPYKWSISSGKLPAGITDKAAASSVDLDLTGTPTKSGTSSFTASVTDCGGHVAKESYTLEVQASAEHVVDVKWNASKSKDVAGYNVYRGPDGVKWTKINEGLVAATDYDDSSVSNGSTYYYSATTVDISGEESGKSSSVKVYVP
jgi:Putative Ig domain